MTKLTALNAQEFTKKAWTRANLAFAAKEHLVPVVLDEVPKIVPGMPMVFVATGDGYQLVALTSFSPGTNLFVSADGNWLGDYVPLALQAYPFRLAKAVDSEQRILCFDEDSGRLVAAGKGEPFFATVDSLTPTVKSIFDLLLQTESSRLATQAAVDSLATAKLLEPWNLTVKDGERTMKLEGLYKIDETKLNAMSDEAFVGLRKTKALILAYAQLLSLNQLAQFQKLTLIRQQQGTA
jgi:hypothetical protein